MAKQRTLASEVKRLMASETERKRKLAKRMQRDWDRTMDKRYGEARKLLAD